MTSFDTTKATAGQVLIFSNGCYSDYSTHFIGIATQDFDILKTKDLYIEETNQKQHYNKYTEQSYYDSDCTQGFIEYLIRKGLLVETNNLEIHCGDYGFEIDWIDQIR